MRKVIFGTILTATVAAGGIAVAQTVPAQPSPAQAGGGLRFSELAARIEAQGLQVYEMDHERDGVEVKATDRDGRRVSLVVDPANGQVLRREERTNRENRGTR